MTSMAPIEGGMAFSAAHLLSAVDGQDVGVSNTDTLAIEPFHRVYNFEVAEHHNYVADGNRVHNTSVLSFLTKEEWADVDFSSLQDQNDDRSWDYVEIGGTKNGLASGKTIYKQETVDGEQVVRGYHTYTDAQGRLVQMQFVRDATGTIMKTPIVLTGADFGEQVGQLLTPFLTRAILSDDASVFETVATNVILGTFVENAFEFGGGYIHDQIVSNGEQNKSIDPIADRTWSDLERDFGRNLGTYSTQALTQWIMAEVFGSINRDTYAGEVASVLANQSIGYILDVSLHTLITDLGFEGPFWDGLADNPANPFTIPNIQSILITSAINHLLPDLETMEGQFAQSVTSAAFTFFDGLRELAGSWNTSLLGSFGDFLSGFNVNPISMVISWAVGRLFDAFFKENPEAYTNVVYDSELGEFVLGSSWTVGDGNLQTAQNLAQNYVSFMNELIEKSQSESNNFAELGSEIDLVFGHYENQIRNGSARSFDELDLALQARIVDTIQHLELNDGDVMVRDAVETAGEWADLLDDATHAGSYVLDSSWISRVFGGSDKLIVTELNPELTYDGATTNVVASVINEETSTPVHQWIVEQANSVYSDLSISDHTDDAGIEVILDRVTSENYMQNINFVTPTYIGEREGGAWENIPNKSQAVLVLSKMIYIRAVVLELENRGHIFSTFDEFSSAITDSGLVFRSYTEIFTNFQYELQIASEYREYLNNQEAYDAAIIAAGTNSAYSQGWAITFLESDRLGFTRNYVEIGNADDNLFLTSSGDDQVTGGEGDDTIHAYSGNDTLQGGTGDDSLDGGSGDDVIYTAAETDAGFGNDTAHGGTGDDLVVGSNGRDTLYGDDGQDTITGGDDYITADTDILHGGNGNDLIASGQTQSPSDGHQDNGDLLDGGAGNDTLLGGKADDTLNGGDGADILLGGSGDDYIEGGAGDDVIRTGSELDAEELKNVLFGGDGDDALIGFDGNDVIYTGGEFDEGYGRDTAHGGDGNDSLVGSNGSDWLYGEAGNDTLNGGHDHSTADRDQLFGGGGNDVLISGQTVTPQENRQEYGDWLDGGSGHDTLTGGKADDRLTGGSGNDLFVFENQFGGDVITDFEIGNSLEQIDLSAVSAIVDFNDLSDNHLFQVGLDAMIDIGHGDTITLNNIDSTDLTADQFVF